LCCVIFISYIDLYSLTHSMEQSWEASQEISRTGDNWIMSKIKTFIKTFLGGEIKKIIVEGHLKILMLSKL
jgi:hypothetical protein